eukprot:scaffold4652_cov54-Attheya_sp.AAC.5
MMIFRKNRSRQAALAMATYIHDDDDNDAVEGPVGVETREPATPVFAANHKILKNMFSSKLFVNKKQQMREATILLAKFTIDDEDANGETNTDPEDRDEADIVFLESDASVAESEDDITLPTMHSYSDDDDDEMTTASPISHDHRTVYYVWPAYNRQEVPPETIFCSSACFSATQK